MGDVRTDNMYSNVNSGRGTEQVWIIVLKVMDHGAIYRVIAITNIVINADHASLEGNPAEIDYLVGQAPQLGFMSFYCLEIMDNILLMDKVEPIPWSSRGNI